MRYAYWLVPVVGLIAVALVGSLLGASASFSFRHPQAPGVKFVVSPSGAVRLEKYVAANAHAPLREPNSESANMAVGDSAAELPPRVVVEEAEYDFGIMNPLSMSEHSFVIRNTGEGPLRLRSGGTTCKCTLAHLPTEPIAPGEIAEVRVQWNSGRDPMYAHSATVLTNDPAQERIELRIRGQVQVLCDAIPSSVQFAPQDPDSTAAATVELYSRTWESFAIAKGTSSVPGVSWTSRPLDAKRCEELNATCGYTLEVLAPADLPKGAFHGVLHFELVPRDETEPRTFELSFAGHVNSRMTVYGAGLEDSLGVIQMGVTSSGKALERRLLVRVRDAELPKPEQFRLETEPAHLQANIAVREGKGSARGLYYLELRVPADAPTGAYLGVRQARLRMTVDHPRIQPLEIPIEFGVLASP